MRPTVTADVATATRCPGDAAATINSLWRARGGRRSRDAQRSRNTFPRRFRTAAGSLQPGLGTDSEEEPIRRRSGTEERPLGGGARRCDVHSSSTRASHSAIARCAAFGPDESTTARSAPLPPQVAPPLPTLGGDLGPQPDQTPVGGQPGSGPARPHRRAPRDGARRRRRRVRSPRSPSPQRRQGPWGRWCPVSPSANPAVMAGETRVWPAAGADGGRRSATAADQPVP